MTGRLPQGFIDELLQRADIQAIISKRLTLKKAGHEFHGLCPFHSEKTPSFTVSPQKRFFYCFGCGASGNVINFVMRLDQIDFREAVKQIADYCGLPLPIDEENQAAYEKNQQAKTLLHQITGYYQKQLTQHPTAFNYFRDRGLDQATLDKYALGYSPSTQPPWPQALKVTSNITPLLLHAGMIYIDDQKNTRTRFKSRLIFPIRNVIGETIAFGGRKLGDGPGAKYLNSPETELFRKSFELYGLYEIKKLKKPIKRLIVVEGYMDVISLSQHGVHNAVATLGTAINKQHIRTLTKYSHHIAFCFDGDQAGERAAWRALTQALPVMHEGLNIHFVFLPAGEDPDSLIKTQGKSALIKHFEQGKSATDFFFEKTLSEHKTDSITGRANAAKAALELIETIPNGVFKHLMQQQLETQLNLGKDSLNSTDTNQKKPKKVKLADDHLTKILSMLIQSPCIAQTLKIPPLVLEQTTSNELQWLITLLKTATPQPNLNTASLLQRWQSHEAYPWLMSLAMKQHLLPAKAFASDCQDRLKRLNNQLIEEKIDVIIGHAKLNELSAREKLALQELIQMKSRHEKT